MGDMINVKNLNKSFGGKQAVFDVSLQVNTGEIYGFLGPNGSGKTTTIRMICGLMTPDSGEGTCLGFNVLTQSEEIKRHVGYMSQIFSLYQDLTIEQNLDFIARMYEMPNRKQAVAESLDRLGLTDRRKQLVSGLSGGLKQRLSLAAAVIHRPKLLLLDEPTAGVDPKARRDFWDQVQLMSQEGITTLVTTHYMDEAIRCNRLAYIMYGRMIVKGTVDEIIAQSGLITWNITGSHLLELKTMLSKHACVEQVAMFGNTLHVSGHSKEDLASVIQSTLSEDQQAQIIPSSLEDVFIMCVENTQDGRHA